MDKIYNNIDKHIENFMSEPLSNKKFSLKKNKQRTIRILVAPKINHIKLDKNDIDKIRKKTLGNEIIKFRKTLYKKFNSENLNLLNNNIKTLKINYKYFYPKMFLLIFPIGKYKISKNKIELLRYFKKAAINHELLHMATSFYDKTYKVGWCGFQQIIFYRKETFGYGLNEGYTELLISRYFHEPLNFKSYPYRVCAFFASKLEEIVGKENMEKFYMNADFCGLNKYLLNLDNESNILTFIVILDYLVKNISKINTKKHERYYELIECYLTKWYINKKKQELNQNIIDDNKFNIQIENYINSLHDKDLYLENYVKKKEYCLK